MYINLLTLFWEYFRSGHNIHPNSPPVDEHDWHVHPTEGCMCDAYFYSPRDEQSAKLLSQFAAKNKQSTAELLKDFFKVNIFLFLILSVGVPVMAMFDAII